MDTAKIIEFLEKIASEIGPLGEQAFNIIKQRIFAEAVVWSIISLIVIVIGIYLFRFARNYKPTNIHDDFGGFVTACAIIIIMVASFPLMTSLVNILSLDYAAIERILSLVRNGY